MSGDEESRLFERAMAELDGSTRSKLRREKGEVGTERGRSPGRRLDKRLRQGSFEPEAVLDLHGLSRQEALERLAFFLDRCLGSGLEIILVIHGKGRRVLASLVVRSLEEAPNVVEQRVAPKRLGGDGARVVRLSRRPAAPG